MLTRHELPDAFAIETERVKDRVVQRVPQRRKISLAELERSRQLVLHLPDAVEEQLEERRLFGFKFTDSTESFRERMAQSNPLFLYEALEAVDGAEVWIHD